MKISKDSLDSLCIRYYRIGAPVYCSRTINVYQTLYEPQYGFWCTTFSNFLSIAAPKQKITVGLGELIPDARSNLDLRNHPLGITADLGMHDS